MRRLLARLLLALGLAAPAATAVDRTAPPLRPTDYIKSCMTCDILGLY